VVVVVCVCVCVCVCVRACLCVCMCVGHTAGALKTNFPALPKARVQEKYGLRACWSLPPLKTRTPYPLTHRTRLPHERAPLAPTCCGS